MQSGYISDGAQKKKHKTNVNNIRLEVSTLGGVAFDVLLPSDATGSALFDEIVRKLELYGSQTVPVALIGNALVSLKENLGSQLRNHGNMIAVTLRQVQKSEQVNVITVAAVQMTFARKCGSLCCLGDRARCQQQHPGRLWRRIRPLPLAMCERGIKL